VAVVDGETLADPGVRPALDRARAIVPPRFDCVIDAALASRVAGLAADRHTGVVVALATTADVRCAALAHIGGEVWIATLGDAAPATDRDASGAGSPQWDRARRYLEEAPIAVAAALGDREVVAAARTAPVEGWIAIDDARADRAVRELGELQRLASGVLHVRRQDTQLIAEISGADPGALAGAVGAVLMEPAATPAPCPPGTFCIHPNWETPVPSVADVLHALRRASKRVAAAGDLVGLRLFADVPPVFRAGDVLVGLDDMQLRSPDDLVASSRQDQAHAVIAIDRAGKTLEFHLRQNE
jgi:hypothetical protein